MNKEIDLSMNKIDWATVGMFFTVSLVLTTTIFLVLNIL